MSVAAAIRQREAQLSTQWAYFVPNLLNHLVGLEPQRGRIHRQTGQRSGCISKPETDKAEQSEFI